MRQSVVASVHGSCVMQCRYVVRSKHAESCYVWAVVSEDCAQTLLPGHSIMSACAHVLLVLGELYRASTRKDQAPRLLLRMRVLSMHIV